MGYYDESHLNRLRQITKIKKGSRLPIAFIKGQLALPENSVSIANSESNDKGSAITTKQKKKKRQEIIKSAIRVFSRRGYHHTKIEDITAPLGISTGTFYLYFANKRDLFMAVLDEVFNKIVNEATEAIKEEADFLDRMKIRGRVFYKEYTKCSEIINQLRAELSSDENWPERKIRKIYEGLASPVIKDIENEVEKGTIHRIDSDLLAYALTGLIEIMALRVSFDKKYNVNKIIEFIIDLALRPLLVESN